MTVMGARQFIIMFFNNLVGQLRQVKRNMMLLLVPILVFAFMYLFYAANDVEASYIEPLDIGIIVLEDSSYGDMVADSFMSYDAFTKFVHINVGDYDTVYADFYAGNYDAILEIPENFISSVMSFSNNPVIAKVNYEDPLKAILVKNFLKGYESYITSAEIGIRTLYDQMKALDFSREDLTAYNEMISYDLIFTALTRNELFIYNEVVDVPSVGSVVYFFIAVMVMFLMYLALFAAINLMRERDEHCLERLRLTKTSVLNYIASKMLAISVFLLLVVLVWLLLLNSLSAGALSANMSGFMLFLFVAILFNVSFAILIASFFRREESVILFANVLIFVNAIIGGSIIPIHIMPESLQGISAVSPNYWMIRGFLYYQSGLNMDEGHFIMISLLILSAVMMIIAGYRFSRKSGRGV